MPHAELAREVVVANPAPCAAPARADSRRARTAPVRNATPISDSMRCATSRSASRKYRCRPWLLDGDETRVDELREMRADRLLGHARHAGKLRRGERAIRHQRGEHFRPGVIADERGDADDVRAVFHGSIVDEPYISAQALIIASHRQCSKDSPHGHHLLHPLPDRSVPARRVRAVRRQLGTDHSALRRQAHRLLPAARGHQRRRVGIDRVRRSRRLRDLPGAAQGRSGGTREFRDGAGEAIDPARGAHVLTPVDGTFSLAASARDGPAPSSSRCCCCSRRSGARRSRSSRSASKRSRR